MTVAADALFYRENAANQLSRSLGLGGWARQRLQTLFFATQQTVTALSGSGYAVPMLVDCPVAVQLPLGEAWYLTYGAKAFEGTQALVGVAAPWPQLLSGEPVKVPPQSPPMQSQVSLQSRSSM